MPTRRIDDFGPGRHVDVGAHGEDAPVANHDRPDERIAGEGIGREE